jgi:hypothetical protein
VPIVTVAGNHSFYRRSVKDELLLAKELAVSFGKNFLENEECEIAGMSNFHLPKKCTSFVLTKGGI